MMKGKAVIPLVLGLVVGLFAVKLLVDFVRKAQASNPEHVAFKAVRATMDIPAYSAISHEMIEVIESSDTSFAPSNERIGDAKEVLGRVASKFIPAKVPVMKSMLAPEGTSPGMVGRIPAGFRAFTVKIDETTGVAYQIKVGDWVDLIVVMDVNSVEGRKKQTVAEVILQHIQVAAVGLAATGTEATAKASTSKVKPAKSATLLVPEQDVPKLHLAAVRGKVSLSLRGEDDKKTDSVQAARSDELLKSLGEREKTPVVEAPVAMAPAPVAAKSQAYEVQVYRGGGGRGGDSVERITFEDSQSTNILSVSHGTSAPRSLNSMMNNRGSRAPASPAPHPSEAAPSPEPDSKMSPEDQDFKLPGESLNNLEPSDEGNAFGQPEAADEDRPLNDE